MMTNKERFLNEEQFEIAEEEIMMKISGIEWERTTIDVITAYKDGEELGTIVSGNPNEDWTLIEAGHDPIAEGWEDGNGNTVTADGWGE